ncbi:hypothetical protein OHA25_60150 (plasmid) [Nonomuraea sp. NBC_00507]|uniref:hypothetical protein n=1 Tax=Nonomuraea sp. NBC_00507 TaxID=2976002 RepID=UPI002E17D2EF
MPGNIGNIIAAGEANGRAAQTSGVVEQPVQQPPDELTRADSHLQLIPGDGRAADANTAQEQKTQPDPATQGTRAATPGPRTRVTGPSAPAPEVDSSSPSVTGQPEPTPKTADHPVDESSARRSVSSTTVPVDEPADAPTSLSAGSDLTLSSRREVDQVSSAVVPADTSLRRPVATSTQSTQDSPVTARTLADRMYVSAGRESAHWSSYTVQLTSELQERLLLRVASDRVTSPDERGKIALAHFVSAALRQAPTDPNLALEWADDFRATHRGRSPKLRGTGTRVHRDVVAAMNRMEALLRVRRYGMFGLFTAAAITRFLDALDGEDPMDPALLGDL